MLATYNLFGMIYVQADLVRITAATTRDGQPFAWTRTHQGTVTGIGQAETVLAIFGAKLQKGKRAALTIHPIQEPASRDRIADIPEVKGLLQDLLKLVVGDVTG